MRKKLIVAASAITLITGAAVAQTPNQSASDAIANSNGVSTSETTSDDLASDNAAGEAKTTAPQSASAEELMGKTVYGDNNEEIGEVEDVILTSDGKVQQLVVTSGGLLGIGGKQVALDFSTATWNQAEDRIDVSGLNKEAIGAMPEFEYTDSMSSLNNNKDGKPNAAEPMNAPAPASDGTATVPMGGAANGSNNVNSGTSGQ